MHGVHNWKITCLTNLIAHDRSVVTLILSQIAIKGSHKKYYRAITISPDSLSRNNVFKVLDKYVFSLRKRLIPRLARVLR